MVDTNCAWTPAEAEKPVAAMKASKPFWVEEPIWPPEDFESLAKLRKATGVPLAMGENATSLLDFRKMIAAGATDFVQPSIVKIGGITHLWQIATEAEKAGVTCMPHAFFFGPGYLATLHCHRLQGKRRSVLERLFADVAFVAYSKTVPDVNGGVDVPDRPGPRRRSGAGTARTIQGLNRRTSNGRNRMHSIEQARVARRRRRARPAPHCSAAAGRGASLSAARRSG